MAISDNVFAFLLEKEGFAGKDVRNPPKRTKGSSGDYGEYLDSEKYPTTGIGMLVAGEIKPTDKDFAQKYAIGRQEFDSKWSTRLGHEISASNLSKEDAIAIKKLYIQDDVDKLKSKSGVDLNNLPEGVQGAILSTMFQNGSLGPNTTKALRKFATSRTDESLSALAMEIEKYHDPVRLYNKELIKWKNNAAKAKSETDRKMAIYTPRRLEEAQWIRGEIPKSIRTKQNAPTPSKTEVAPSQVTPSDIPVEGEPVGTEPLELHPTNVTPDQPLQSTPPDSNMSKEIDPSEMQSKEISRGVASSEIPVGVRRPEELSPVNALAELTMEPALTAESLSERPMGWTEFPMLGSALPIASMAASKAPEVDNEITTIKPDVVAAAPLEDDIAGAWDPVEAPQGPAGEVNVVKESIVNDNGIGTFATNKEKSIALGQEDIPYKTNKQKSIELGQQFIGGPKASIVDPNTAQSQQYVDDKRPVMLSDVAPNTMPTSIKAQKDAAIEIQKRNEYNNDLAIVDRLGNHVLNSFMTENIVGQYASKKLLFNDDLGPEDKNFDPTKSQSWQAALSYIKPEHLADLVGDVKNQNEMNQRISMYMTEENARKEMAEFTSVNPVTGFGGIIAASFLDVTSFVPVNGMLKAARIGKLVGNMGKITKFVGGAVLENLVQDMAQEIILTSNSDIRRFSDGDILVGAVGSIVLGGAAGSFKFVQAEKKYINLVTKYQGEKNLAMIDRVLLKATKEGYPQSTLKQLTQVKTKALQDFDSSMKVRIAEQLNNYNAQYKDTFLNNQKVAAAGKQMAFEAEVDAKIDALKLESKTKIADTKTRHKQERVEFRETIKPVEAKAQGLRNRIKDLKKSDTPKAAQKAENLKKELVQTETKINQLNKENKKLANVHKNELAKVVKEVDRLELNSNLDGRINLLKKSKAVHLQGLADEFNANKAALDIGQGTPNPVEWDIKGFNEFIKDAGFDKQFKTVDELDNFLGLKFADSAERFNEINPQSMGAARTNLLTKSGERMTKGLEDSQLSFIQNGIRLGDDNPDLGLHMLATKKDSYLANVLRRTAIYKYLNESSWWGRTVNSINALKNSENPIANGIANQLFSNKGGRVEGAALSIEENATKWRNIAAGTIKKEFNNMIHDLKPIIKADPNLRADLGFTEDWKDFLRVGGADFEATMSSLVRNEKLDNGITERLYGADAAKIVNTFIDKEFSVIDRLVKKAQKLGVEGAELIKPDRNYMHRSWDNDLARQFAKKYGDNALIDLVYNGINADFLKTVNAKLPAKAIAKIQSKLKTEAKAFAFGLTNADLTINQVSTDKFSNFLSRLENQEWDGIIDMKKFQEKASKELEALDDARKQVIAHRKQMDLNASVEIGLPDGTNKSFFLKDLLDTNLLNSQNEYINYMVPRIALGEKGILSMEKFDEMVDVAQAWSTNSGDIAGGKYIQEAFTKVKTGLRSGGIGPAGGDKGIEQALSFVKKYNYARLMQYTGISSLAELGMTIPEAGFKATWDAFSHATNHWYRTRKLSGASAMDLQDELTDTLGAMTGIGLEGFNFASTRSSKTQIYKTGAMSAVEKGVDNMARVTHGTTSWIETATRKMTINALAQNMANVMTGKSKTNGYLGGLSDFNLVELGLATREKGAIKFTPKYEAIQKNIMDFALDVDGNLAATSGKRIHSFDLKKWDLGVADSFGDVLTQRANHILVNPDVSTQSMWHSTLLGSIINQFKSFSQAAHAKVAMHNVNGSIQAIKNRESAELIKGMYKLVVGAAFGKVSLMAYAAVHHAGRDDYEARMAEAMSISDFRDWTKALGRGSVITGLDSSIDTGIGIVNTFNDKNNQIEGLFNSSTIGQSRDALNFSRTATGQLYTGALTVGQKMAQGKYSEAGGKFINMTPIRRTAGLNQLFNLIGID